MLYPEVKYVQVNKHLFGLCRYALGFYPKRTCINLSVFPCSRFLDYGFIEIEHKILEVKKLYLLLNFCSVFYMITFLNQISTGKGS